MSYSLAVGDLSLGSLSLGNISTANIVGNILFSGIGYVAFMYGKRMEKPSVMIQGGILTAYSYFVSDTLWMYLIGTGLTAWIWFTRENL